MNIKLKDASDFDKSSDAFIEGFKKGYKQGRKG